MAKSTNDNDGDKSPGSSAKETLKKADAEFSSRMVQSCRIGTEE